LGIHREQHVWSDWLMATFTYNTLLRELKSWSEDDSDEFASALTQIIRNGEKRIFRDLDHSGLIFHSTTTLSTGDPYVTKPDESAVVRDLVVLATDGNTRTVLVPMTRSWLEDYWPDRTQTSTVPPKYWAEWTATVLVIAPTPAVAWGAEMAYSMHLGHLSTDATASDSNWLTRQADDLLLAACMVEAERWHKNLDKMVVWDNTYKERLDAVQNESRRMRRDDTKTPTNVSESENTVRGNQ